MIYIYKLVYVCICMCAFGDCVFFRVCLVCVQTSQSSTEQMSDTTSDCASGESCAMARRLHLRETALRMLFAVRASAHAPIRKRRARMPKHARACTRLVLQ